MKPPYLFQITLLDHKGLLPAIKLPTLRTAEQVERVRASARRVGYREILAIPIPVLACAPGRN
jgi:hypothetical protein